MGAIRLRLLKSYHHKYKVKPWPVGQIIQVDNILAHELLSDKIAEIYEGEYPPKNKLKMNLNKLKQ